MEWNRSITTVCIKVQDLVKKVSIFVRRIDATYINTLYLFYECRKQDFQLETIDDLNYL